MRIIFYFLIIAVFFGCKSPNDVSNTKNLAELIIEIEDKEQIKSLENKIKLYRSNPETVISKDFRYCYDTSDNKCKISRGSSKEIKENIEWFLLIDNLSIKKFIIELDISSSKEDVIFCLNLLAKKKGYILPEFSELPEDQHEFSGSYLGYYSNELNKKGLTLINFYINSDSYVTALIKKENLEKIINIASKSNNKITEYSINNIHKI